MPGGLDTWWGVNSAASGEIVTAMNDYGLPWLNAHLDPMVCAATRLKWTGQRSLAQPFIEVARRRR